MTVVDVRKVVLLVGQIKNTLQEAGKLCQSQQSREDFTRVNTEGSPQDVNH